jgi:heme-degrading monooxygenase HmoA
MIARKHKITRIWRGKTKAKHADEYLQYIIQTGLKEYRQVEGNLSVKILRRIEEDICHFVTISEWDSYDSIKAFAGNEYWKAKYYKKDEFYLLNLDGSTEHFETVDIDSK